ncbi:MAG: hypothetical protein ACI8UR_000958 [Natronomonas sp.]|jgi:hypothetical protein|uniref:hypothetical protein n=1 Tax=Natronomonas sp. TaxID=2184060 RepID=UPI003989F915
MTTSVHQLDDGAWLSVNDSRQVNVSDLWWLARHDFCGCEMADFLAEGFVEISVDHPNIEGRIAGRCINCGTEGVTDWLTLGRVVDPEAGGFHAVDPTSVHIPEQRTRLATPHAASE